MSRKGYQRLSDEGSYAASELSSLTAQVQNVKGKKVYVFGDGTVASDNEDTDNMELTHMTQRGHNKTYKSTKSSQPYEDVLIKEIPLHKDDTLQSLSIKFRCPISEIKRINGIISDQEFYACTALKIPVRSHQHILQQELEQIAQERNSAPADQLVRSSAHASDVVSSEVSDNEEAMAAREERPIEHIFEVHSDPEDMESISLLDRGWSDRRPPSHSSKKDKRKFEKIITKNDNELKEIKEKVQRQSDALDEVTAVMRTPPSLMAPLPPQRRCPSMSLSLPCVIVTAVICLIGFPILFAIKYL